MQGSYRISVITICYNAAEELSHTLKSVAQQDYPHIEYIVIDGASTDTTPKLLEAYRHKIDIIVSEPDKGIYDAMNKGLRLSTGDYLCFMNAGDTFFSKSTLSTVFSKAGSLRPDVIYGETNLIDNERNFLRTRRLSAPDILKANSFLRGMTVCHQSFYPRRELAPPYDLMYKFSSDYDWCIKILKQSKMTFNSRQVLTNYLSEGATTKNHKESLKERYCIMVKHYGLARAVLAHIYIAIRAVFKR